MKNHSLTKRDMQYIPNRDRRKLMAKSFGQLIAKGYLTTADMYRRHVGIIPGHYQDWLPVFTAEWHHDGCFR